MPRALSSTAPISATWKLPRPSIFAIWAFPIYRIAQTGYFDSAVVKAGLEFKAPARVDEVLELHARVVRIGNTSLTLSVEIYPVSSERLLTLIEAVYVGFYADAGTTRPVPDEIRSLVDHFEATGAVLDLGEFPELAAAAG